VVGRRTRDLGRPRVPNETLQALSGMGMKSSVVVMYAPNAELTQLPAAINSKYWKFKTIILTNFWFHLSLKIATSIMN